MSEPILVLGDVMTDVVAAVDQPFAVGSDTAARVVTRQGGAGANVAACLGRQGISVIFVGVVGVDPFGVEAREALAACGVDVRVRVAPGAATGTCVVLVGPDGERTMLPDAGANSLISEADLPPDLVALAGHLHVSGYSLLNPGSRPAARQALRLAHRGGVPTSVDPASAAPLQAVGGPEFLELTAGVDLAFVTLEEAEVLVDSRDPMVVGARLTATYAEVVLKLGAQGARWCSRSDPGGVAVPAAPPQGPVVDSTGAGDAFAAAWLGARHRGAEPVVALAAATKAAARTMTQVGARS